MKINTKITGGLVLAIVVFTFNSCKKAEVEQISPYQSANHRILGTWQLKSITETTTVDDDQNISNNVNSDSYTFFENATTSKSYSGSTLTTTYTSTSKSIDKDQEWDNWINPTKSVITTNTIDNVTTTTSTEIYTKQISIYKDYTYNSLSTTYTNQGGGNKKSNKSNITITVNGVGTITSSDTTYTNMDMVTVPSEGTWSWSGSSTYGKLQLVIGAGLMGGIITSLSETELVIEANDNDINNNTDYDEVGPDPGGEFYTYESITIKDKTKSGIETTINTNTTIRTYTEVWVKISSNVTP